MEKINSWIYGFCLLFGGFFLTIFMGYRIIDFFSKVFSYYILILFIVLLLYGVILILIGILVIPIDIRLNKSIALIIFLTGILIVILSFTILITYSFTLFNIFEIVSGIGIMLLGIRLFLHPISKEHGKMERIKIIGIIGIIIGLTISLPYGFSLIGTIIIHNLEFVFYDFPFLLLPFLFGITLLIFGVYSVKTTYSTQEIKIKSVFSILMGAIIILTSGFVINSMINHSHYFTFYTPFFPFIFIFIGMVLFLYGLLLHKNGRKISQEN